MLTDYLSPEETVRCPPGCRDPAQGTPTPSPPATGLDVPT